MMTLQFNAIVAERVRRIEEILSSQKAVEYARRRSDRLSNFKRAAAIKRETPEKAWLGMWAKHLVSILDMVDDIEAGGPPAPVALWEEKIGDAINYLVLLEALIKERQMNMVATQTALQLAVRKLRK